MMIKKLILHYWICLLAAAPVLATEDKTPQYLVECAIYRLHTDISGNTSLTEDIRTRANTAPLQATLGRLTFFTLADLKIGNTRFHLDQKGASWNGQAIPPKDKEIVLLSRPRIALGDGVHGAVEIAGEEAMQYMAPRADGLYELKTSSYKTGLKVNLALKKAGTNRVELDPFSLEIEFLSGRKPLALVQLEIGEPQIKKNAESFSLGLALDRPYGIQWHSEHQGVLLLILRVQTLPAAAPASASSQTPSVENPALDLWISSRDIFSFKDDRGARYLAVTMHHNSAGTASSVEARFFLGDPDEGGKMIGQGGLALREGARGTEAIPWEAARGKHEIFVIVDPDHKFSEVNKSNNRASLLIIE